MWPVLVVEVDPGLEMVESVCGVLVEACVGRADRASTRPHPREQFGYRPEKERAVRARQDASIYRLQLRLQKELSRRSETAEDESRRVCA